MKNESEVILSPRHPHPPEAGVAPIENDAAKTLMDSSPIFLAETEELRRRAYLWAVHFATRMGENRVTLEDVERTIGDHEREKTQRRLSEKYRHSIGNKRGSTPI